MLTRHGSNFLPRDSQFDSNDLKTTDGASVMGLFYLSICDITSCISGITLGRRFLNCVILNKKSRCYYMGLLLGAQEII